jgi:multidrug resistance efflux pump
MVVDQATRPLAASVLLSLIKRAQQAASRAELQYAAVNETHQLAPFRQAALWLNGEGVVALSGVVSPEANAPYTRYLDQLLRRLFDGPGGPQARVVRPADLSAEQQAQWGEWLPEQGLLVGLPASGDFRGGLLLLARDEPWTPGGVAALQDWGETLAHAMARFRRRWFGGDRVHNASGASAVRRLLGSRVLWGLVLVSLLMLLPVRLTVLAPAELVPRDPAVVRSPLDGVVERVLVEPNERVLAGQPLFEFDRVGVRNRLQIARRALEVIDAEYRQKAQLALLREDGKSALALLQAKKAEQEAEIAYLQIVEERGMVGAPVDGVVMFDDPSEWIGRPTLTGERVMLVADERKAEVEAWLSLADAIPLAPGARVAVYLNADPLTPVAATLRYIAYQASERPDGTFAYRVRAGLDELQAELRIGLKGTAKLEGESVTLAYWLLRRPLAAARAWLGV